MIISRSLFLLLLSTWLAAAAGLPRMYFADASRNGRPFAKDPTVIHFGGRYLMYYSMCPSTNAGVPAGWAIGIAESRDLVNWSKVGEVLPEQPCEKNGLVTGKNMVLDGKVHMVYSTYGNGSQDALCHAVSTNGIHFERNPSNPILRPTGKWNSGRAIDCDAFPVGDQMIMLYATRDPSMKTQMLVAASAPLRSDFGAAAWKQIGDAPVMKPELPWETRCIEAPSVLRRGKYYYLFYGGGYNNDPQQIGCARSTDGVTWTRLFDEPLIPNGDPEDWNYSETGHPGIFEDVDGRTYLFVQGNREKGRTWFLSAYEIGWTNDRPVVLWDSTKFPMKRPPGYPRPDENSTHSGNPVFPGWYADPEATIFGNTYWIYPTFSAPFDRQVFFDAFSSPDLVNWRKHAQILSTNEVKWARRAMWAPAAVENGGRYFLFFGANDIQKDGQPGGIGVAVAESPAGPFKDYLGKPLIDRFHNGAQPIDQFVFKDSDGQFYLFYGGWRHCNVARLQSDFRSMEPFPDGQTFKEVTPKGYVEGPFMFKRGGKYYFMWSEGGWTGPDYSVAYAIADSPLGPFERIGKVLEQDATVAKGAGHHSVLQIPGSDEWYIVYHRRPLGETDGNYRVTCIDRMGFSPDGRIKPVKLTFQGVPARRLPTAK